MSYRIIGDSCTDLTKEQKQSGEYVLVPLTLQIGDEIFIDDQNFNQKKFIEKMSASSLCPKSACPAPEEYMNHFDDAEDIYIVTLSAQLSGSNNCAELAKKLYIEQKGSKNIEVFDSKSASIGQTLIAMKVKELADKGLGFKEIVEKVNAFRDGMRTLFVLDSLENLRKNGRLSNMKALIVNALNIKPLMTATPDGNIDKLNQARGIKKSLLLMVDFVASNAKNAEEKILAISHCNNYERALFVKAEIEKRIRFKEILIADTAGVSTLYASDGGIIVCY